MFHVEQYNKSATKTENNNRYEQGSTTQES